MKVLITGATGLVGKQLTKLLLSKKYSVNYLTTSKNKIESKPNYQGFYWNINTNQIDKNCIKEVTIIIHLAGATIAKRWTTDYKKKIIDSRIKSGKLLFETLKNNTNTVKHFISASGSDIYKDSATYCHTENSTFFDANFLANVVQQWESVAQSFSTLNCITTIVRTALVLDKNEGAFAKITMPIKYYAGAAFGTGDQIQPWIHSADLVTIYFFIIEKKLTGVVNAVSPQNTTNQQMIATIAKELKKPLFLPNIPKLLLKIILGEMHILLLGNHTVVPQKLIDAGYQFKYPTLKLAIKNLLKNKD